MPPAVCLACEAEVFACAILHTETFVNSNVLVVFEYEHFVRELIVRAKTKNDIVAMGFILKFMGHCAQDVVRNYDVSSTLVVPAPPSFWGRVRGRFDLAQMASLALFSRADVFTGALPGSLFRGKRAGRNIENSRKNNAALKSLSNFNTTKEWATCSREFLGLNVCLWLTMS